jgi:glycosyltransferase involved in cell wall biosynthesis
MPLAGSAARIRVLHVVRRLDLGGLEMVVLNLVRGMDRERFECRVLCLGERGAIAFRFDEIGVSVETLGARGRTDAVLRLTRRLWRDRIDVLHTHNPAPHLVGAVARTLARVPVLVHTKHGRNYPGHPRAVLANRWASRNTDAVVAVSEDAAEVARRVERVTPAKVRVIHNGIDLDGLPAPERRSGDGYGRAVSVARLHAVKDQATLFRAARRIADARPQFRLALVGDGPERPALERLRHELALEENVCLHGHRDDVQASLRESDIFMLSSASEGLSLTLLEAMAAGLPVIATDVGGNREVVTHGETGLLVAPGSPEALAAATLSLLDDPARALAMGRAGRQRVERVFDLRLMVRRYEDLYRELIARKVRGTRARALGLR